MFRRQARGGVKQCSWRYLAARPRRGNGFAFTGGEHPPPRSPELLKLGFGSHLVGASGAIPGSFFVASFPGQF